MKKVLITIVVVLMLLGIAGATAGYFFIYRPAKAYIVGLAQLREIPKLDAQVRNRSSFTPPTNAELTTDRVERFIQAQNTVRQRLGTRVAELDRKYQKLHQTGADRRAPSATEALSVLRDLAGLVVEAKRFQVEALNQHNFSVGEYEWTRARVYEASDIPVNLNFQYALREVAAGKTPDFEKISVARTGEVPDGNRALVAPHLKELTDAAPLAFFGL